MGWQDYRKAGLVGVVVVLSLSLSFWCAYAIISCRTNVEAAPMYISFLVPHVRRRSASAPASPPNRLSRQREGVPIA